MKVTRKITVLLLAAVLILSGCQGADNAGTTQTTPPVTTTVPATTEPTTVPEDTTPTTVPLFVSEGFTVLQTNFSGRIYGSKIALEYERWEIDPFQDPDTETERTVTIAGVEYTCSYEYSCGNYRDNGITALYKSDKYEFEFNDAGVLTDFNLGESPITATQKYTQGECQTLAYAFLC